jgi:GT2 family glycosyltransferase
MNLVLTEPRSALGEAGLVRPVVRGKFLWVGNEKLYVNGVTYGTFRPDERGEEFHDAETVATDFRSMAESGINSVRTYTVPPRWLLDTAQSYGLYVMVGLPWEQHVAFLSDTRSRRSIVQRVRAGVRSCAGHPAVLGYAVGNEIPAPIVRWHGRRRVEHFLNRLVDAVKDEDPGGLVTYVNFPSTEYLELSCVDVVTFNVYLESPDRLKAYLARLQNLAGDRPLIMAELGLDSRRNGLDVQARALSWQLRSAFEGGCAGTFVYAWTDEWHRGGHDIEDWDFGITDRERQPKPALAAVRDVFAEVPFAADAEREMISVVVCSHNGGRTIAETCEALLALDYPDYEVIVVDDGSRDETAAIASEYGFRVISTENRGLSAARNIGLHAASGKIVAYLDDDAYPDKHWLQYLAHTFATTQYAAVGGPNIAPPDDGPIAACVARAPGGPIHVLVSDDEAEHVPGCNMAFRRDALLEIGGFDESFRVAGDDVDACWRIQEQGWKIGFSPGAMVWHRRRNSVRAYLRQQRGYGRAEALLERKWPQKYNGAGHVTWAGRIYGDGTPFSLVTGRPRVRYGRWGTGLFQRLYRPEPTALGSLPLMPEWLLLLIGLAGLSALGALHWPPLLAALPLLVLGVGLTLVGAGLSARRSWHGQMPPARLRLLTMLLFLAQPAARLLGRIEYGLHPWRSLPWHELALPLPETEEVWSEQRWRSSSEWITTVEEKLTANRAVSAAGGPFDRWDLEVRSGLFGRARLRSVVEEHGAGRQLVRFRLTPVVSRLTLVVVFLFAAPTLAAGFDDVWLSAAILGAVAAFVLVRATLEVAAAMGALRSAVEFDELLPSEELSPELLARVRHVAARDPAELLEDE